MRAHDWSQSPTGATAFWPQSLKTTVRILLTSRFSMWMGWGPELAFFYNDAYKRDTLGVKHPWALGRPASEVWAEIWQDVGPRIAKVLQTGEATWDEGLMLFLERSGYQEETYHTFSYSPLADDTGTVSGMLCVVTEETERVIGERRLTLLREVTMALATTQTEGEVYAVLPACLETNARDLPFTLLYLFEGDECRARLVCSTGVPPGHPVAVPVAGANDVPTPWPLEALCAAPHPVVVDNLAHWFDDVPCGPWSKPPAQAIAIPIAQQGQERPAGFLVAGVNPYRLVDAEYWGFIGLMAGQIAASLANARAYEEERRRAEALAELDRAKTVFFSNVSHEFRTPLTLILGPIDDILARPPDEVYPANRELLTLIQRNAQRLLKLVNTLLDFTRIEAGRMQARYVPTDLAMLTMDLASVFRSAVEKAGLQLLVDCPPLPEPVFVDRDMWEKIVLNLLSNAFKFTMEGEIAVTLREQSGQAVLAVRDTGAGIAPEQLPHIFERFHRVEGTRARTHEGTGIGLALVQELAKLHGGGITAQSVFGKGTTFTVTIPLGQAHLPTDHVASSPLPDSLHLPADALVEEAMRWLPEAESFPLPSIPIGEEVGLQPDGGTSPSASGRRPRVLLADDNADMRDYVRRLLHTQYDVVAVADGHAALESAQQTLPDLVVSDVMMPRMDGFELLGELRGDGRTAHVPVILLSARAGEEARIEGVTAGADAYLTKPFAARELLARVAGLLELARVRREAEQSIQYERARLTEVFQQAPAFIAALRGPEHRFEIVNPPYYELAGHRDLIGKTVREAFPEIEGQGFFNLLDEAYRTAKPFVGKEMRILLQTEPEAPIREHYIDFVYQPLVEADGSVSGIVAHGIDVTERRRAEEQRRENQREIEEMNARLRRAMTETHHRVKNNLQLISALIDMQRAEAGETIPTSELARLSGNVRALGIIHDILTQESKEGNDGETLSAKTILDKLVQVLRETLEHRTLKTAFDDARVEGRQATSLALVTNELVSNAVKHGKGNIELTFSVQNDYATLEVSDDGPGFPAGFNAATSSNTGLELVENVVRWDLRGTASYANRTEGGARIAVTFPVTTLPTE